MSKSRELQTTTNIVKDILQRFPKARNSDDFLYYKVCEKIDPLSIHHPFWEVIINRKIYGIPPFESVRRCRQKIQASCPELAGDANVEGQRMVIEEVFRDYARSMI